MHTLTFGGTHGGSTTPENGFLSPDSLRWSVSDAPRDYRQYHNEYDDSNLANEIGEGLENYNHFQVVNPKLRSQTQSSLSFSKVV